MVLSDSVSIMSGAWWSCLWVPCSSRRTLHIEIMIYHTFVYCFWYYLISNQKRNHIKDLFGQQSPDYKTNIFFAYLSITDGFGLAEVKRLQGTVGMNPMGKSRHQIYHFHEYNAKGKQDMYEVVQKFYTQHPCNVPDDRSIFSISHMLEHGWKEITPPKLEWNLSSKSWLDLLFQILPKFCQASTSEENDLAKKITKQAYM